MWKTGDLTVPYADSLPVAKSSLKAIESERSDLKIFSVAIENEYL
jgi:hypothetical protein